MDQPQAESRDYTMEEGVEAIDSILGESDPEQSEEVTTEAPGDEADAESEEDTDESEESEEVESEEAEPEEDSEEPQIESLSDLAEALGVPVEELAANLKHKIKVQGEELEVTLAELTQGYQKDADYRQKTTAHAREREEFKAAVERQNQEFQQGFNLIGQLLQSAEKELLKAPDPSEMEYLKQTDPQQYLIRKGEFDDARQRFDGLRNAAAQAYQQHAQQLQQWQAQQRQEAVQKAMQELPLRVPEWSQNLKTELDSYLTSEHYGFTPEELAQVTDPRLVEIFNKARLYDTQSKQADATKKKIKTLPKVQKPVKGGVKTKVSNLQKVRSRLAKSGSIDDGAAAIGELLFSR